MATKIILKKSSTGGSVPLTSDLDNGELAVNLIDRKIYTNNGSTIVRLDGAYVDSTAPANPIEGDLWFDTANNLLKAHNGTAFVSAGYQTLEALEDTNFSSLTAGDYVKYDGSEFVNASFETDAEALFSAANTGTGHGDLSYANGVFTYDRVTAAEIRGEISVTDAGGDGSLAYDNSTGVLTYTGPSAAEVQAHITAGTGVSVSSGEVSIGQAVETTSDVTFNNLNVDGELSVADPMIVLHDANTSTPAGNAGIEVYRGGTEENQRVQWNETDDKWEFVGAGGSNYATVKAAAFEGPLSGTISGDVTGDVYAANGTSKVLENGTDGTNATFTGAVTGTVSDISNHTTQNLTEHSSNLYFTDARARAAVSVTDAGGDGSLAYDSGTGVFTYTGPSAAEVQAHITAGTGVTISSGQVAIGQEVETTSNVEFAKVTTNLIDHTGDIVINPDSDGSSVDDGTVTIQGNLTVTGTTTSVNSNEVNIGDSVILLNSDETGTPSQNAGFEVERGTAANKSFVWNEADDKWDLANEELQNVVLDGGSY